MSNSNEIRPYEFPAPRFQNMGNGEALATCRGKPVLIRPYVTGQVIEDLSDDQVSQVGIALAKLHEIPAPEDLPDQHAYVMETYPQVAEQEIDQGYRKWVKQRCGFLVKNIPGDLPVGLVHGDPFTDNVLFEDGKFKAFLDFEEACQTSKVFDLGMAVLGICVRDEEIVIRKARALVNGYQKIRSLEKSEKDGLQVCIEYAAVLTSAWRFWKYNMDAPDPEKSNDHMKMVKIAKNINAMPGKDFKNAVFA